MDSRNRPTDSGDEAKVLWFISNRLIFAYLHSECRMRKMPLQSTKRRLAMHKLKLEEHSSLLQQVYEAILNAICDGRLLPGERLGHERLAEMLDVSRQPVSHALALLKEQGFVCRSGRRGLVVAPLEVDFVRSLYEYRAAIDLLAAGKAADACTPASAAEGKHIIQQGKAASESQVLAESIRLDSAFHQWIYELASNRILTETMNHYWKHMRRVISAVLSIDKFWPQMLWAEHDAIWSAISDGNRELAEHLARAHVEKASEALCEKLTLITTSQRTAGGV